MPQGEGAVSGIVSGIFRHFEYLASTSVTACRARVDLHTDLSPNPSVGV